MLTFTALPDFPVHGPVMEDRPDLKVVRTPFFGTRGVSEIVGNIGGRFLKSRVLICGSNYSTPARVRQVLSQLDGLRGTNGTLRETGTITESWQDCTFEGFERETGITPDPGRNTGGLWFVVGWLVFYHLSPRGG